MRITTLASSYPRFLGDGTAPFVQSLSEHLVQIGHAVEIVAPYDPAVSDSHVGRVHVHRFRYSPVDRWHIMGHARSLKADTQLRSEAVFLLPLFLLAEFISALRIARRQPAQIIHAHWVLPNGLVGAWLCKLLGIPLAISLHGSDIFVARRNRAFGAVAGWVFRRAAVVTACSEDLLQAAISLGAAPESVHLIAWGADPTRFSPAVRPLDRALFDLTKEDTVLVCLGRIVPKKGFDVLLHALPALLDSHPELQLVIGGDGDQRERLAELAVELGISKQIRLPGRISWEDVPAFLAMGDLFVLPSVRDAAGNVDGLPTVLLEAMALGKPVVATQIGGVPLVIEHGENGILCPPGNTSALEEAIAMLLENPSLQHKISQAARTSVEERFNWLEVAKQFEKLFTGACEDA